MDPTPHVDVTEQLLEDVPASGARLHVSITDSEAFTGQAALKQAKEVRRLLQGLGRQGIVEEQVSLQSVYIDVKEGIFSKSSSATYRLAVRCEDLDLLPGALDAITSQKNCTLGRIEWLYEGADALRLGWLQRCIHKARAKAEAMCQALGQPLGEVLRLQEQALGDPQEEELRTAPQAGFGEELMLTARRRGGGSIAAELPASELAPTRRMGVRVLARYRIGAAPAAAGPAELRESRPDPAAASAVSASAGAAPHSAAPGAAADLDETLPASDAAAPAAAADPDPGSGTLSRDLRKRGRLF